MRIKWLLIGLLGAVVLSISFFVLATTFSKPSTMTLNVPPGNEQSPPMPVAEKTLTIYLADKQAYLLDRVAPDAPNAAQALTAVSIDALEATLKQTREKAEATIGKGSLVIIMKPLASSSYTQMVNTLDVFSALKIKRYALVDKLSDAEETLLAGK